MECYLSGTQYFLIHVITNILVELIQKHIYGDAKRQELFSRCCQQSFLCK